MAKQMENFVGTTKQKQLFKKACPQMILSASGTKVLALNPTITAHVRFSGKL
jgi:hypothetical protein